MRWLRLAFACGCLLVVSPAAIALAIAEWTTPNGARVLFAPAPELPMFDLEILFDAGSLRDGDLPGLAAFASALLDEGTARLDADAFHAAVDDTGAVLGADVASQYATVSLRSLASATERDAALGLLCEMLASPRFDPAAIKRQRQRMRVGLQRMAQSPAYLGDQAFTRAIYGGHPYAAPAYGTEESLSRIDRAALSAFQQRYLVARNALILIVGALDRPTAEAMAARVSSALPAGEPAPPVPPVPKQQAPVTQHIEFASEQTHVFLGQLGIARDDPDYFPLMLANHVLGGDGVVSRLFDEIRERRGLSYGVDSHFEPMRFPGPFVAGLQTGSDQAPEAVKVLREVIREYVANGPTPEALEDARRNLIESFPMRLENNARILDNLAVIGFYHLPLDYLDRYVGNLQAVTLEQAKAALRRHLQPERMTLVTVGRAAPARH